MPLQIVNKSLPKGVKLFIDSDGVFADFDTRVEGIFGKMPEKFNQSVWDKFMAEGGFAELPLMPYGQELARQLLHIPGSQILTGTPRPPHDDDAAAQKKEWYARKFNLNPDRVICCMSYMKPSYAAKAVEEGLIPVLIDDKIKAKAGWEMEGGIFIHYPRPNHVSAVAGCAQTLKALTAFAQEFSELWIEEEDLEERLWEMCWAGDWELGRKVGMGDIDIEELKIEAETQLREYAEWQRLNKPLVTGGDLVLLGLEPGPRLGLALKAAKAAQDAGNRNKASLLEIAMKA